MNPDETTNEFEVDSPEAHQAAAAEAEAGAAAPAADPTVVDPLPPADDIAAEAPAAEMTPGVPDTIAAEPLDPEAVGKKTEIAGLKEEVDNSVEGKALATKQKLAGETKVRMMIPLDPGEKAGAFRTVIINGYRFDVRKNTMVDLPQSVAALLSSAYAITTDVVENHPTNLARADAQTQSALDA